MQSDAVVCVLVTVVTMTKSTCIKASAHHVHGRDHGSTQADMVLETELRVLHLDLQVSEDYVPHWM